MNNYNWFEQQLHRLALSSKFIRQASFDFENLLISTKNEHDNHIFIAGLARSGTTSILNAIYKSDQFASLSYADMPFVLAPNLWSKMSFYEKGNSFSERAHGDNIFISKTSPEAFEEIFWNTFNEHEKDSLKKFKAYIKLVNHRYRKERYLSKNNHNIKRLKLISKLFPNSKILIPYRNPIQHAFSLLTQHKKFIQESKKDKFIGDYMKFTGHSEFGPNYSRMCNHNLIYKNDLEVNHWIEQWIKVYKHCIETSAHNQNVLFICYEKLCNKKKYWSEILKNLKIKKDHDFE